jgi:NAD+ diphosphatase
MVSASKIDRQSQLRADSSTISGFLQSEQSRTLLWQDGHFLMQDGQPRYFTFQQLQNVKSGLDEPVYLGQYHGHEYFAAQIKQAGIDFAESEMMSLRRATAMFSGPDAEMMVYAQGILNWLRNHAFCSRCGSDTTVIEAGHGRRCNNTQCAKVSYPKIDPAVIFSIVNNTGPDSKILLGRKSIWDENRYSVIAGFVEPGETLEDAVKREAYEETGVKVENVEYIGSQPWPFPDSLMLGFCAQTKDNEITLIDQELEKASWFTAEEIETGIKKQLFKMPFKISIAWRLINYWFTTQKGYSVDSIEGNE